MKRFKISCISCKKEIQNYYFDNHKCRTVLSLSCEFCKKQFKNLNSSAQHLIRCKSNPNRVDLSYLENGVNFSSYFEKVSRGEVEHSNQYTKAIKLGLPKPIFSVEILEKLKENGRNKVWDDAEREKHSLAMKRAVANTPESYTSSNRGRTKQIIYNNIKFQGNWELKFYKWCETKNIECERNSTGFSYEWNGKRTYYPDFYLPIYKIYVEVKGYKTDKDNAKWNQFPHKLLIIEKQSIYKIERDAFQIEI